MSKELSITDNDLLLFKYLFEHDFLPRDFIVNFVWNNLSNSYCIKRMVELTNYGFINKVSDPTSSTGKTVLMATEKALDYMFINIERVKSLNRINNSKLMYIDPNDYKVKYELDLGNYRHDRYMCELRFLLENNGADNWITDRILGRWRSFKHTPDGLIQISLDNKLIYFAIELELHKKQPARYKDIFLRYQDDMRNGYLSFVIYVFKNDTLYDYFTKILNTRFTRSKGSNFEYYERFFLIKWNDILKSNLLAYSNFYDVGNGIMKPKFTKDLKEVFN